DPGARFVHTARADGGQPALYGGHRREFANHRSHREPDGRGQAVVPELGFGAVRQPVHPGAADYGFPRERHGSKRRLGCVEEFDGRFAEGECDLLARLRLGPETREENLTHVHRLPGCKVTAAGDGQNLPLVPAVSRYTRYMRASVLPILPAAAALIAQT